MNTERKTFTADESITACRNAEAAFNNTVKETQQSLNAGSNRDPLTRTEYRRAVVIMSQAIFDFDEKMRQFYPEAFPDWYHKNISPAEANHQNIDAWDCIDAAARRWVKKFIMADDTQ